jgi:hypothetical protein
MFGTSTCNVSVQTKCKSQGTFNKNLEFMCIILWFYSGCSSYWQGPGTSLVLFVHIISWSSESGMQPLVRFSVCNFPAMKNQPPGNLIQIYHLNYKAFNTIGQLKKLWVYREKSSITSFIISLLVWESSSQESCLFLKISSSLSVSPSLHQPVPPYTNTRKRKRQHSKCPAWHTKHAWGVSERQLLCWWWQRMRML